MTTAISSDVFQPNLQGTIDSLRLLEPTVNLSAEIANLTALSNETSQISSARDSLLAKLRSINTITTRINLTDVSQTLRLAQSFVNDGRADVIIARYVNATVDGIYARIADFVTESLSLLRTDVGRCRPLYDSIDFIIDSVCIQVYPVSGIWFSLGCCMILLIPSLALAAILSSMYRYADYESHTDDIAESGSALSAPDYCSLNELADDGNRNNKSGGKFNF
jgi:hypothetical protein